MALYENFLFSKFPKQIDTYEYMQDLNIDTSELAKQYQLLISQKKFSEANQYLIDNPSLSRSMFNAEKFNKIIDSIKSIQTLYKEDIQTYITNLVKNKGIYSSSKSYNKYDVVYYNSLPYLGLEDNIPVGVLPTDTSFWYPLAIRGDKGESGTGLTPRGSWNESIQYYKDDVVSYNNSLWAATKDNIGYFPNNSSSIWCCILSVNIFDKSFEIQESEIDEIMNSI